MSALLKVRTALTGSLVRGGGVTTMYFDFSAAPNPNDILELVEGFWDDMKAEMMGGTIAAVETTAVVIESTTGQPTGVVTGTPSQVTGTGAGDGCPPTTQGLLQLLTGEFIDGRQLRGRVFLPAIPEGANSNGQPGAGYTATAVGAGTALLTGASLLGADWVVYSRTKLQFAPITSTPLWNQWASLRSRRD